MAATATEEDVGRQWRTVNGGATCDCHIMIVRAHTEVNMGTARESEEMKQQEGMQRCNQHSSFPTDQLPAPRPQQQRG